MKPVLLVIRDGWGENHNPQHDKFNAVKLANLPVSRRLTAQWPRTEILAHGLDVGLPVGIMGNSEVGHQNIGAGRIVDQEIVRIDKGLTDPAGMRQIKAFRGLVDNVKATGGAVHLMGLCSEAGVHSTLPHLYALLRLLKEEGLTKVYVHAFMDGRDSPPTSGLGYLQQLEAELAKIGVGRVASVAGRFWAMDRDNRWDRTEKAYRLFTEEGETSPLAPQQVLEEAYAGGTTDEFIEPTRLAPGAIRDGDGLVCFNFRPDRVRQLVRALVVPEFNSFEREPIRDLQMVTFTQYEAGLPVSVAFPPESLDGLLGQVVSESGLRQFRTAETEKYPHVTYFMNGGIEQPYPGEDRHLVPSPRVATYDQAPAMSADQLTDNCIAAINKGVYSLVVINYANPDMVGHTGEMEATVEAIGAVDRSVGRLLEATNRIGGTLLVTADHGNAELMEGPDGRPWTAHTTNPVPVILVEGEQRKLPGHGNALELRSGGGLADIAPTVLEILGLPQPARMTGHSLIVPLGSPVVPSRIPQTLGV